MTGPLFMIVKYKYKNSTEKEFSLSPIGLQVDKVSSQ